MLIGWRGGETDRSRPRIGRVGRGGVARARKREREGAGDRPACQLAGAAGERGEQG